MKICSFFTGPRIKLKRKIYFNAQICIPPVSDTDTHASLKQEISSTQESNSHQKSKEQPISDAVPNLILIKAIDFSLPVLTPSLEIFVHIC